jgi:hypothetical protein
MTPKQLQKGYDYYEDTFEGGFAIDPVRLVNHPEPQKERSRIYGRSSIVKALSKDGRCPYTKIPLDAVAQQLESAQLEQLLFALTVEQDLEQFPLPILTDLYRLRQQELVELGKGTVVPETDPRFVALLHKHPELQKIQDSAKTSAVVCPDSEQKAAAEVSNCASSLHAILTRVSKLRAEDLKYVNEAEIILKKLRNNDYCPTVSLRSIGRLSGFGIELDYDTHQGYEDKTRMAAEQTRRETEAHEMLRQKDELVLIQDLLKFSPKKFSPILTGLIEKDMADWDEEDTFGDRHTP